MLNKFRIKHTYLWSFFKRKKWSVLFTCVILLSQTAFTIFLPLPVGFIFDKIIKSEPGVMQNVVLKGLDLGVMETTNALYLLCFLGFAAGMFLMFLEWLEQMVTTQTTFSLNEQLRKDLFYKIFTRKQSYMDTKRKVDIMGRLSGDIANLEVIFCVGIRAMVNSIPTIFSILFMMFAINGGFTMRFFIALPIFGGLMYFYSKRLRAAQKILRRKTINYESETHEAISSLAIVKSFRGEDKILEKLIGRTTEITRHSEKTRNATVGMEISMTGAYVIIRNILICIGAIWVFNNKISVGDLLIFMSYMGSIIKPINDINKFAEKYPKCAVSMDRIEELNTELDLNPETCGDLIPSAKEAAKAKAFLTFDKVSFQYNEGRKLFDNFSVEFKNHSLIAIVGQSGIGKSSFSRLLNRLHDPQEGSIKLGNTELRDFEIKALRSSIRVLSQETFLIAGTVRENLNLAAKNDKTDEELEAALEKVNALGFVKAMSKGLDTEIGESGQQISGGQAKRIHLARAFLDSESSIFLLDEPTTGLDTITAQKVIKSVQQLAKERNLVFWVTHRMDEVHLASKVLFFTANQNPLLSTHDDLYAKHTQYRALIESEETNKSPEVWRKEKIAETEELEAEAEEVI